MASRDHLYHMIDIVIERSFQLARCLGKWLRGRGPRVGIGDGLQSRDARIRHLYVSDHAELGLGRPRLHLGRLVGLDIGALRH